MNEYMMLLYYVLCIMCYVLCIMYHILCIMYCVLCIMYYVTYVCLIYELSMNILIKQICNEVNRYLQEIANGFHCILHRNLYNIMYSNIK